MDQSLSSGLPTVNSSFIVLIFTLLVLTSPYVLVVISYWQGHYCELLVLFGQLVKAKAHVSSQYMYGLWLFFRTPTVVVKFTILYRYVGKSFYMEPHICILISMFFLKEYLIVHIATTFQRNTIICNYIITRCFIRLGCCFTIYC